MAEEWWVLFPLKNEISVGALPATIPDGWLGGFHGHNALTLGRGMEVPLLSCWLLAPRQTISRLAPLRLPLQNREMETHRPDEGTELRQ